MSDLHSVLTLLPRSKMRLAEAAGAAFAAGRQLYFNGRTLVSAARHPGAGWSRVGVRWSRSER
jgi:hypothetical protein